MYHLDSRGDRIERWTNKQKSKKVELPEKEYKHDEPLHTNTVMEATGT